MKFHRKKRKIENESDAISESKDEIKTVDVNVWLMKQVDALQEENKKLRAENVKLREDNFSLKLTIAKAGLSSQTNSSN